jgi:site-specific DNA recombinase
MKHANLLNQFAKGKSDLTSVRDLRNAVIYTRVSSKEQADTNQSLEVQKKYCLQYALKHELNILGFFGGTYESAKTDERNEFNKMIKFVKNQKEGVSVILVYSLDRFSRTGDNAIFISSELKRRGISIASVTQPIDVSTHAGVLQQNIQFIFSKYDNDLRREKSITGMREKLLRGEWTGGAPVGYSYDRNVVGKEQHIAINGKGLLIRRAFEWKVQGMSNTEVAIKISKLGLPVNKKRLSELFRNPFYCGLISHNLLEGKIIQGKHEGIITEELFLRANEVLKKNAFGYKQEQKNIHIPLKNYVHCASCSTPMTGYIVRKKNLYYYKCNKIGCKNNRSAILMHGLYADFLRGYQVDHESCSLLKEQLLLTYEHMAQSTSEVKTISKQRLGELQSKLEKLEERFAYGEIDRNIFEKIGDKLKEEIRSLEAGFEEPKNKLSNPEKVIAQAVEICSNLSGLWVSGGYDQKVQLQNLLFPEGVLYDRGNDNYRTTKINLILELTHSFSNSSNENKKGQTKNKFDLPAWVTPVGIEPTS